MKTLLALVTSLALSVAAFAATKGAQPAVVSHGETIKLTDYLVPGKTTVFDFSSKYCGPCQAYNETLELVHAQRADVAVVKVDINRPETKGIDWKSPVAQQFKLESIPHFKVYGPDGKLVAEDLAGVSMDARKIVDKYIDELK